MIQKLKLEILLPIYYNIDENDQRQKIEGSKFAITFNELVKQFRACTHDTSISGGSWLNPDTNNIMNDETKIYWLIYDDTEANNDFLKSYKEVLKSRFRQVEIYMYSFKVDVI